VSDCFAEKGVNEYQLRINGLVICHFTHDRSEGLAQCLRDAACAAEAADEKIRSDSFISKVLKSINP